MLLARKQQMAVSSNQALVLRAILEILTLQNIVGVHKKFVQLAIRSSSSRYWRSCLTLTLQRRV